MPENPWMESINDAISLLQKIKDPNHDVFHTRLVVDLATNLCSFYDVPRSVIETAAWWHESGRGETFANYEEHSAELAQANLVQKGLSDDEVNRVIVAIKQSAWNQKPTTMEGKILRDANILELFSVPGWKHCLEFSASTKTNAIRERKRYMQHIPSLKTHYLDLPQSHEAIDTMLPEFMKFLNAQSDPEIQAVLVEIATDKML